MPAKITFSKEQIAQAVKMHCDQNQSVNKVAKYLNCNWQTAERLLKDQGREILTSFKKHSDDEVRAIYEHYLKSNSAEKTGKVFGISGDTVLSRFHSLGLEIFGESSLKVTKEKEEEIIKVYKKKQSLAKTAEKVGVSSKTVRRILIDRDVPRAKANHLWEESDYAEFRGTRFGYLLVLDHVHNRKRISYNCLCDPELGGCGSEKIIPKHDLISARTLSCGCKKSSHPGLYLEDTLPAETPTWIYLLKINSDKEEFFKIGLTIKDDPKKRFNQILNYKWACLKKLRLGYEKAFEMEKEIKALRSEYTSHYWPRKAFNSTSGKAGGRGECFIDVNGFLEVVIGIIYPPPNP